MINLLPPQARQRWRREQRVRFLSAILLAVAAALAIAGLLLVPTWIMQQHQIGGSYSNADFRSRIEADRKDREQDVKETARLLRHFAEQPAGRRHTELVTEFDQLAGPEVRLTRFEFDAKNKLTLSGHADTRAALSSFRDRLSQHKRFSAVELPLTNLVQDRDATFTLTLTIK